MCLFPFKNTNYKSEAYKKGIKEFDCGCCPECLSKRARLWSLRCSAEAQKNIGCMITLTYDQYERDERGRIIGELPPDRTIPLSKRDCQLFIKRLRKHFKDKKIKYLITAERGKRTQRAHYHAILFGVDFTDKIKYKKSDRGNIIYKSATLSKLWNHGICTIDAVNINSAVARYCTKYCAKDTRADDTFMLMSRNIGDDYLLEKFNGISYVLDGYEYSIPKQIWNKKITDFYRNNYVFKLRNATYKYRSLKWYESKFDSILANYYADYNSKQRKYFRAFRDSNNLYKKYLEYWQNKALVYDLTRPPVLTRILQLDSHKYFSYKNACLDILYKRKRDLFRFDVENFYLPPRYNSVARKCKVIEKEFHLPAPLVIKGQMTPFLITKNKEKPFKYIYNVKNWLYGDKTVYLFPLN